MKQYCFGIDIGGTTVKCGLFTAEGHMAHHGHTVDVGHGLARKTAGAHAGGDDGDDSGCGPGDSE